jgi:hypothetical protein
MSNGYLDGTLTGAATQSSGSEMALVADLAM